MSLYSEAEVRRLREQLRTCQTKELKRLMSQWSGDWFGDPQDLAPDIIWHAWPDEGYPGRELDSMAIVEFGRAIDAWITDDGQVVTIGEWEKMLEAQK